MRNNINNESQHVVENSRNKNEEVLDFNKIINKIWDNKRIFAVLLPIVFFISCIYILTVPRYYSTSTALAPEVENSSMKGGLGSIAATFGFDLSDIESSDAITPLLYPELMKDNKFVVGLFDINISTEDKAIKTNYYSYLKKYQRVSWLEKCVGFIKALFSKEKHLSSKTYINRNPYMLSKTEDDIVKKIQDDIKISVDKKSGVISINATAQDPMVCKILADSVTSKLQKFITTYRTSKAQKEADYYKQLMSKSLHSYELVREKYGAYSDANMEVMLESVKSKIEDMENDMQLKYNQYTTYNAQYQAAVSKVLEKTPVFTLLKGAEVPLKPAGPKRMIFVFAMTFMAFILISLYAYFFK